MNENFIDKLFGNSKSKNVVKTVNETITKVINTTSQSCAANVMATQNIKIKTMGSITFKNSNISQKVYLDVSCLQNNKIKNTISNQLKNELMQLAQATAGAINFSKAKSKNVTEITNKITNIVENEITQEVMSSVAMENNMDLEAVGNVVFEHSNIEQFNKSVLRTIQTNDSLTDAINDFANTVTQDSDSSTPGLFDIPMGMIMGIALLILIVIVMIFLLV